MRNCVNYLIENKLIENGKNEDNLVNFFNKKLAIIILNLENKFN